MKENSDNAAGSLPPESHASGIEQRIFRAMLIAVSVAVVISLFFADWRVTTGLLLGGALSLLNHHWLRSSTAAAFSVVTHGAKPKLRVVQYVLRYLVIAAAVCLAYKLNIVSLAATITGLCSFVVALFAEACREFYLAIIHREETS